MRITAEDRDSGQHGTAGLVYKLSGSGAEKFQADSRTGLIRHCSPTYLATLLID